MNAPHGIIGGLLGGSALSLSLSALSLSALSLSALSLSPISLLAQETPPPFRCDGQTVSHVEIRRSARTVMEKQHAPGWARTVLQPLLLGVPTRASAIAPFLQLHDGGKCSEQRRAESERLLRSQPFLADATVRTTLESDGRVLVEVETVDDLRPIISVGVRDSRPTNFELGNSNIDGSGQLAAVRWRDGRAFRDGFGARYVDYSVIGTSIGSAALARNPLGSFVQGSLGRPFYTDLQHSAAYVGYQKDDGYVGFVRPDSDAISIKASRERADMGIAFRLNVGGTVRWLLGAASSYERRSAGNAGVIITDTGFAKVTSSALDGRYQSQTATRAGIVTGIRALTFVKAESFDALEGTQDVGRGAQLATTIGKGIGGDDHRTFVTTDVYTGVGTAHSFVGLRFVAEARQNSSGWGNTVGSGRLAWYLRPSARQTQLLQVEYAGSSSDSTPYQLTIGDAQSGVRGYTDSRLAGARRVIARAERRFIMPGMSSVLGWGVAGFADVGHMWAGSVPYAKDGTRGSVGVGLLVAVPRKSRSLARLDVAYPLAKDQYAKSFDVRFTYRVTGRAFWREPAQLARARLGSPTTDIFTWP